MTDARKKKNGKTVFCMIALNKKARQNFKKEEFDHAFFQKKYSLYSWHNAFFVGSVLRKNA